MNKKSHIIFFISLLALLPLEAFALEGDFNNDGTVNALDYSYLNGKWNTYDVVADINKDGKINSLDFAIMKSNWGKTSVVTQPAALSVNITAPVNNARVGQYVPISVQGSTVAAKIEIYIDGVLKNSVNSSSVNWTWDNFTDYEPTHFITAKAYDSQGKFAVSPAVYITVDDAIPAFPFSDTRSITALASQSFGSSQGLVNLPRKSMVDRVEITAGQTGPGLPVKFDVYGYGVGGAAEQGLLFTVESSVFSGQVISKQFIPPLRNITAVKVVSTGSASAVGQVKVTGSLMPASFSTPINNIRSATYYNPPDYNPAQTNPQAADFQDFGNYFDLAKFKQNADKAKTMGFNAMWFILPWNSFDRNINGRIDSEDAAAVQNLTSIVDYLNSNGMRAILPLNYGSYPGFGFTNRNVWKNYQVFIAGMANRFKNYNNVIFMNFTEGSYPSPIAADRGSSFDTVFSDWAKANNPSISYWNAKWGTNYADFSQVKAFSFSSSGQALSVTQTAYCQDDIRWISSRAQKFFGVLPAVQEIYGNPGAPYGYHDYFIPEAWTLGPGGIEVPPTPTPNSFDIASYGFYPDGQTSCHFTDLKFYNTPSQWLKINDLYTKINRVIAHYPSTQVFFGELGVGPFNNQPDAATGEQAQAQIAPLIIQPLMQQHPTWGFSFWQMLDTDLDANTYHHPFGIFRLDGSAKPVATPLASALGGAVPAPASPAASSATPSLPPPPTYGFGGFQQAQCAARVSLFWNRVSGNTAYNVYRNQANSFAGSTMIVGNYSDGGTGSTVGYLDNSVQLGQSYYYWIVTVDLVTGAFSTFMPVNNGGGPIVVVGC